MVEADKSALESGEDSGAPVATGRFRVLGEWLRARPQVRWSLSSEVNSRATASFGSGVSTIGDQGTRADQLRGEAAVEPPTHFAIMLDDLNPPR